MTVKQVYRGVLIEMNKTSAPSFLLEDFNYLVNKAIYQYINKRYNVYDMNQQTTDDISTLKSTTILQPKRADSSYNITGLQGTSLYGAIYEVKLPLDYLHILNCICNFKVKQNYNCYNKDSYVQVGAKRLTSDMQSLVLRNYYTKPSYTNPYYFINNIHNSLIDPLPSNDEFTPSKISIGGESINIIKNQTKDIQTNSYQVRLEIRCGEDNPLFELTDILVEYLRIPQVIKLTQDQLEMVEDTSQIMEFPDYVCQEIINELVKLFLENTSDPRLQTNLAVNQTIASPIQQQSNQTKN